MQPRPWHKSYDAGVPPALDFENRSRCHSSSLAATEHGDGQTTVLKILRPELPGQELRDRLRGDET